MRVKNILISLDICFNEKNIKELKEVLGYKFMQFPEKIEVHFNDGSIYVLKDVLGLEGLK